MPATQSGRANGSPLAPARRLEVIEGPGAARPAADAVWVLRGVTSNERYVTAAEHRELAARGAAGPRGGNPGSVDSGQEVRGVVGSGARRTAADLRGKLSSRRYRAGIRAGGRAAAGPRARPRRAFRLLDLVRVRPR